MAKGSSSSSSTSAATNTQNLNLQEIDGVAVAGVDGNVSITTTDSGTVDAARAIALTSLDNGLTGFQESADIVRDALNVGAEQTRDALGFATSTIREAGDITRDALLAGERQTGEVLDFARDSQSGVFDLVERVQSDSLDFASQESRGFRESLTDINDSFIAGGQALLSEVIDVVAGSGQQAIDTINTIQARESGNTDARLQEITRIAIIGAGVVAAGALFAASRK